MSVLTIERLSIGYRQRRQPQVVGRDLSAVLPAGEFTVLLGPNGVGKSTLMRTCAGLQPALDGRVLLDGRDLDGVSPRERATLLGVVLTEQVKAWGLTARALVALGRHPHLGWNGRLSDRDHTVIERVMHATGADELGARQVGELSDGERQRVMIARALAQEPRALILDEVTAFLDLPRRVEIMLMLRRLARESGTALLLSTHDLDLALRTADRLWLLAPGCVLSTGTPETLVLNGAFDHVFLGEGLEFDREAGTFQLHERRGGRIGLGGEGLRGIWTRRALERLGFEVVDDAHVEPRVSCDDSGWVLSRRGGHERFDVLDSLTAALSSDVRR